MKQHTARGIRPRVHVYDNGSVHWRGGQLWRVDGDSCVIRVRIEAGPFQRDFTGPLADVPARTVGSPLMIRLEGTCADDYAIAEIRPSTFADPAAVGTDEAATVQSGLFSPGVISDREDPNWKPFYD